MNYDPEFSEDEMEDEYESLLPEMDVLPDEDVPDTKTSAKSNDLPVRWLRQFAFIDVNDDNAVHDVESMIDDEHPECSPEGYGLVQAVGVMVDNDEADSEDGDVDAADMWYRMRLGSIIKTWSNPWDASEDSHLWVQTQIAWYILVDPAPEYIPCHEYSKFNSRTRALLSTLLSHATNNYKITWKLFLQGLADSAPHPRYGQFDRSDFEGDNPELVELLYDAMDNIPPEHEMIKGCPLLRKIGGEGLEGKVADWIYPSGYPKHLITSTFSATPLVAYLANPYFSADRLRILDVESTFQPRDRPGGVPDPIPARLSTPDVILRNSKHIIVNGVDFHTGHTVLLHQGHDETSKLPRFGLLKKFLKSTSEPYYKVLVAVMLHSSETILGELGSPSELFLTTREVVIDPDMLGSVVSVDFTSTLTRPDMEYECRFLYDTQTLAFTSTEVIPDIPDSDIPQPMRALDLFAGTGGLAAAFSKAVGGEQIRVEHAIDNNGSAAETMRHQSHGSVHCQDVNDALERAVLAVQKQLPADSPLNIDIEGNALPPPVTEGIDVIFGGFPCQGHSILNLFRRSMDARNPLLIPQLAWVEFLKPKYCIFENVPRFVTTQLSGQGGEEIENGYLKFLVKALLKLGYQCHFSVFQAAHYGSPQTRQRFVMVAACLGMDLPPLPRPTHQSSIKCFSLERHIGMPDTHNVAVPRDVSVLLAPVSIRDSIKDLPLFDWNDDHINHDAIPDYSTEKALQHMTTFYTSHIMTITTLIRMEPGASSQDLNLPESAKAARKAVVELRAHETREKTRKSFVRLGWHGQFHTIVTNVSPVALSSHILHPICRRVLTVRELARAQGFPDSFVFKTVYDDDPDKYTHRLREIHRQLGNAVPWQLATAIGQEFRKALWGTV